ncbi:MAG TPA: hypothetical protein VFQ47_02160 [Nitrososphaera sp.]|nr:hypothetical protein [Nitrososphaera sp.]
MEDEQHQHFLRQESKSGSQAEEDSPPHSQNKEELPMRERESHSSSSHEHHHAHHSAHAETTTSTATTSMIPESINYNVNVQFDPSTPQAGKPTHLNLIVTEQKVSEPVKQFDVIHDKLMHLIIVNSEDLSHFAHIHPRLDKETGIFHITHTFAKAGKYKMWIDVKPKGAMQILTAFPFNVEGQPVHSPAAIAHEQTRVKNVVADGQSYQVMLNCQPEHLVAGGNVKMTFEIRDANGKPISNLEPLMAAGGHCVIIDADAREFLHVHPAEEITDDVARWRGGPSVSFLANFPNPGLYRAWGQFQHEGRLLTADFTFEVVAG